MDQDTWEEINMIIQEADYDRIESARDWLTEDNVDEVAKIYMSSATPEARATAAALATQDYMTPAVRRIAIHFISTVTDDDSPPIKFAFASVLERLVSGADWQDLYDNHDVRKTTAKTFLDSLD